MEKNYRLFVRNLPQDIANDDFEKLFNDFGAITNIDIKNKIQNDGSKIAFVNLATTDAKLNDCFRAVNKAILRGNSIRVEVAKESFLDRLKREREEAASTKTQIQQDVSRNAPIQRINIEIPKNIKCKPTKRIYNFDDAEESELTVERDEKFKDWSNFADDPALCPPTLSPESKSPKIDKPMLEKSKNSEFAKTEKKILSESEIKRLASVMQKRQTFRANEKLISQALKAVDTNSGNKKIVFSEDIDVNSGNKKKSKSLFDDDGNSEEPEDWDANAFQHDEKRNAKLKMSLNNLGRDKRFIIDERFLDEDENPKGKMEIDEGDDDLKNETKWQLNILENVLGKPFRARDEKLGERKQNKMIRYDPTSDNHRDHEMEMQKPVTKVKKVKSTNAVEEQEELPPPVSNEVFYNVSENLTDALKPQEEFSLLKSFGTTRINDKNKEADYETSVNKFHEEKWESNNGSRNPFKYESSDDEAPYPSMDEVICKNQFSDKNTLKDGNESFFFNIEDGRFHEAEIFCNTRPATTDNFTNVRRGLKQIVRSKIRNNVRKNTPWRNSKQNQGKMR